MANPIEAVTDMVSDAVKDVQKRRATGWIALVVFIISLVVFARITPGFVGKMWYPTGDEPYYLLIAHSLIHDRDIEPARASQQCGPNRKEA